VSIGVLLSVANGCCASHVWHSYVHVS
jgi:hypothetical protein